MIEKLLLKPLKNAHALMHFNDVYKADEEVVLIALSAYGHVLEYADDILKSNRSFILKAVKQGSGYNNHSLLLYCDEKFRSDKEIMMEAIKSDWEAYDYASIQLQNDEDVKQIYDDHKYIGE